MAATDLFKITVRGKGGHGSMPHQGVDAVVAASAIVKNLQSLVSGEISPLESAVVSVGIFEAGTRFNENSSRRAAGTVEKLLGKEAVVTQEKVTGGEDFAFFLEKAPGLFAFLGACNSQKQADYPHHHERFNIDEDALEIGVALYAQYAIDYLNE